MTRATLTPEAKEALRKTIRGLRERLLRDILEAAEGAYRLSVKVEQAGLSEAQRVRRERLEAWLDEQIRSVSEKERKNAKGLRDRLLTQGVKEAAHTLVNRLVFLRYAEALGLSKPKVLSEGWKSQGYKEFRDYAPELCDDETEGFAALLELLFDELAYDLPGLFGKVGLTSLFPIPASTLRHTIEELDDPELAPAWTDDTTLGWVYQFWNDPEREALDDKINDGGKIEPHEIASKTQMFTERYMVEWLLHNSLGQMWLAMCQKHGWTPEAKPALDVLDKRRAEWRQKREAGEIALDALMPLHSELEQRWKYWVPQPMPKDSVERAPESLRSLKLLDPACGSGHFLVVAFDLLAALYREEAQHLAEDWSDRQIAEWIVHENLHGIDIDPRAVQVAAAALWAKAKSLAPDADLRRMNLVAPALRLAQLPTDDPALVRLTQELEREVGLPAALTAKLMEGLAGVDHLGTLLKVDQAIDDALKAQERALQGKPTQGDLFRGMPPQQLALSADAARSTVLDRLEKFLSAHAAEHDLGLRLEGEQLAAGVRFVRMAREGAYDIVVTNPPYQGTSRMLDAKYVAKHYPRGKDNLFAAFLERGLELVREGGVSALLTMRGWMFLGQFSSVRKHLLDTFDLRAIGDFDRGAFDDVPNEVLAVVASIFRRTGHADVPSVATQPTPLDDKSYDRQRTGRKRGAVLAQVGRFEFDVRGFEAIEGEPIVYWWTKEFLERYAKAPKLGAISPVRQGLATANGKRFLRSVWEVRHVIRELVLPLELAWEQRWPPLIKGAAGRGWFEPLLDVIRWERRAMELNVWIEFYRLRSPGQYIKNERFYFQRGIAYTTLGSEFRARLHRFPSVIDVMGASVFPADPNLTLCVLNSSLSGEILGSLAPGIHFTVGDLNRLPFRSIASSDEIVRLARQAFVQHESHRESSVEFKQPGPSAWRYAQDWAQRAVDRPEGAPLPPYEPQYDPPDPKDFISFAIGVALGRFGKDGEGILDETPPDTLPAGILFVSDATTKDSLTHQACAPIHTAWQEHGAAIKGYDNLHDYLRRGFFKEDHKSRYENRPIYFPLSSEKKGFVAWVSIHRWTGSTLQTLLADHLLPEKRRLEGELDDLRGARSSADKKTQREAERRFATLQKLGEELDAFIASVRQCAEKGPPPTDPKCTPREVDAPFAMDLDDGVMVNSSALWPLLEPQWKDPKKWWKELADAKGKKDYDWSHLAARYFPTRVDAKCKEDPSLGVAHHCFWKYHSAKAYAWELRLQDEVAPDFRIDEPDSDECRARFLRDHADDAREAEAKEHKRRDRKRDKSEKDEGGDEPLFQEATP